MPMRLKNGNLRIGLIGAGAVGQLHAEAMAFVPGLEVAAIADLRPQLRDLVADKYKIERRYHTHTELLADDTIDAVAVVVRRGATSAVVRDCLLAGKHVLSEKPMAMTAAAAAELVGIAQQKGVHYAVGFQKRHDPGTLRCLETLQHLRQSGDLGQMTLIRSWNHTGQDREESVASIMTKEDRPRGLKLDPEMPSWLPATHAASYDRFVNAYCHDINMLHFFLPGSPSVRAAELDVFGGQSLILAHDQYLISMALTLSEVADWSRRGEWDEGLEFHFEAGRLFLRFAPPLYMNRCAVAVLHRGSDQPQVLCDGTAARSDFTLQAENFLADLRDGRPSRASGQACLPDMDLIERIWQVGARPKKHDTSRADAGRVSP